ncbi:hypothetical protein DCC62_20865 [candidate division KSB1 bacterium]|nr:MAG: hypothetical protein DCC62_20865 [candidate division KSB1 bacterium]
MRTIRLLSVFAIVLMGISHAQTAAQSDKPLPAALDTEQFHGTSDTAAASDKKMSIGGAFLRSATIPGWGQKAVGARTAARNFFVADVALWLGVISFNVYGNWQKDDYRLLAAEHAQVNVPGKTDKFFVDAHFWRWDSEVNRARFDEIRLRSERAFNRGELVIAAIIANHIVSGIHAAWLANRHNSRLEEGAQGASYVPQLGVKGKRDEIRLTAQWEF